MSDEIVCPDCGGYIGLEPGDSRQACSCFSNAKKAAPPAAAAKPALRPEIARMLQEADRKGRANSGLRDNDRGGRSETVQPTASLDNDDSGTGTALSDSGSGTASTDAVNDTGELEALRPKPEKACRICGKDLAGHRRIKDSAGYLCRECAKTVDNPAEAGADRRPCPECNRPIKVGGFVPYNGKHICRRCFADHMELDKYKKAAPSSRGFVRREKQKLGRLLLLAGVLLLFMVWSAWIHFGPKH